jgi:putative tryptophan/tyrosine transport system substrate-binding protein
MNAANLDGFRQGLWALGYVEGKNYAIEYLSADGRDERFPSLATELVRLKFLDVRKPEDLEPAFDAAIRQRADALVVGIETLTQTNQRVIVDLAARRRLPAIYASAELRAAWSPMERTTLRCIAAPPPSHRIFTGTKPADLPIEEPTRFELVINLRTAKALGLTIPPALLLRADQAI